VATYVLQHGRFYQLFTRR